MSPDEIAQVAEVIDIAIAQRMEQVYGVIEELRQQVSDAVESVNATAQVLHDNDTALMAKMMADQGNVPAEFTVFAAEAWQRFVVAEAKELGLRIVVPK